MDYMMHEGYFPSANQTDNIYYRALTPKDSPCGVVLVLHGMRSHSGQYHDFLHFCARTVLRCMPTTMRGMAEAFTRADFTAALPKKTVTWCL